MTSKYTIKAQHTDIKSSTVSIDIKKVFVLKENSCHFFTFSSGAGAAKRTAKERYNDQCLRDTHRRAFAPRTTAMTLTEI